METKFVKKEPKDKLITIRATSSTVEFIKKCSKEFNLSQGEIVEHLINFYLESNKDENVSHIRTRNYDATN